MGSLKRLLAPRSIATVGAAPAERVIAQCRKLGFDGPIWPVHPTRTHLGGLPCVPSLDDLAEAPDAIFLGVNRQRTLEAMASIGTMKPAGGAVCYASGFAEVGETRLQRDLVWASAGTPFFGPNCYGFVNTFDNVALWPDEHGMKRHDSGVAIIAQSGNVGVNFTFQDRGLRLAMVITVGNQASVGVEQCVETLLDDERITAIGIFLEALVDPLKFGLVVQRAHEVNVPIVVLQTGRSAAGASIAASHTASLAGRAGAYDALFRHYGVPRVNTPSELIETLKVFDRGGALRDNTIVSLSCSGGEASLVADHAELVGLDFADFAVDHRRRIEATVTEHVSVSNPFDYHTFMWADRASMAECFTQVLDGPQAATMLVLDAPPSPTNDPSDWLVAIDALADAADHTGGRAIVLSTLAECQSETVREHIASRGLVGLQGLSDGLTALGASAQWDPTKRADPHAPVADAPRTVTLHEAAAKERLRSMGLPVPHGKVAIKTDRILAIAREIGFPVTLKALGFAHKSEHGAVYVGVKTEKDLLTAIHRLPASDVGYLVEQTIPGTIGEVLVAVRRDPPVGWLVTIGAGGIMTELLDDVVHLLAPVNRSEVEAALRSLRTFTLLDGFRGRPRGDIDALVTFITDLAERVVATNIVELELNPVLVASDRRGVVAVDALLTEEVRA